MNYDVNNFYYDLMNPTQAIDKAIHSKGSLDIIDFRYILTICNTKISEFRYEKLPSNLTSQIVETALLLRNNLCFYNSPVLGLDLYRFVNKGEIDAHGKPIYVDILTLSGTSDTDSVIEHNVPYKDIVLVKDNTADIPPILAIWRYIDIIKSIEDTLLAQMEQLSMPYMFKGNKKQVNTYKQLMESAHVRKPFVVIDENLNGEPEKFDIKLSVSPLDIYDLKTKYKYELLNLLGIYSIEEKRERFVAQEVSLKNDSVDMIFADYRYNREQFVKQCNERFGTNIELKCVRDDVHEQQAQEKARALALQAKEMSINGVMNAPTNPKEKEDNKNESEIH